MRKLLLFVVALNLFFFGQLFFATSAFAALCPAIVQPGSSITSETPVSISFDLSGENAPGGLFTGDCNSIHSTMPSGGVCYEIWACNKGVEGPNCSTTIGRPNFTLSTNINQPSKQIRASEPKLSNSIEFWLEKVDKVGNRTKDICPRQEILVDEQTTTATCGPNMFKVVKAGTTDINYTYEDNLEIIYNGNEASGFHDRGVYAMYIESNQSQSGFPKRIPGVFIGISYGKLTYGGGLPEDVRIGIDTRLPIGQYTIIIVDNNIFGKEHYCSYSFEVSQDGNNTQGPSKGIIGRTQFDLCRQAGVLPGNTSHPCAKCAEKNGVWTAVGCIPANPTTIVQSVVQIGLGIAGGVTILMMLAAGFMLSTSQGDPKRTTEAREMITSAVIGLLFIIFSVTILQFIGVKIFQLPGFGGA